MLPMVAQSGGKKNLRACQISTAYPNGALAPKIEIAVHGMQKIPTPQRLRVRNTRQTHKRQVAEKCTAAENKKFKWRTANRSFRTSWLPVHLQIGYSAAGCSIVLSLTLLSEGVHLVFRLKKNSSK
jgi:hypothetical protein